MQLCLQINTYRNKFGLIITKWQFFLVQRFCNNIGHINFNQKGSNELIIVSWGVAALLIITEISLQAQGIVSPFYVHTLVNYSLFRLLIWVSALFVRPSRLKLITV